MKKYIMGWSQAEGCDMVVYADSLEDAKFYFEAGEYVLEEPEDD